MFFRTLHILSVLNFLLFIVSTAHANSGIKTLQDTDSFEIVDTQREEMSHRLLITPLNKNRYALKFERILDSEQPLSFSRRPSNKPWNDLNLEIPLEDTPTSEMGSEGQPFEKENETVISIPATNPKACHWIKNNGFREVRKSDKLYLPDCEQGIQLILENSGSHQISHPMGIFLQNMNIDIFGDLDQ